MGAFEQDESGFAAVDALTALVILSTTIALSIGALSSARKIEQAATEAGAARTALQLIIAEPSRPPGSYAGVSGNFDWTLQVSEDLEAVYRNELHRFLVSPGDIEAHSRAANEAIVEKEKLVASTESDVRKIDAEDQTNFDLYRAGSITSEAFGGRHHPLQARRGELETELPRLQAELDVLRVSALSREQVPGESQNLMLRWNDLPFETKREIVETIITG